MVRLFDHYQVLSSKLADFSKSSQLALPFHTLGAMHQLVGRLHGMQILKTTKSIEMNGM
tara:strand:+ start:514 stop:690 length:177 start_codon:yes stop_codon:yes gene_type:complete